MDDPSHNLKVIGSNPIPATKLVKDPGNLNRLPGFIIFGAEIGSTNINGLGCWFKSPCNQTTS
jgi:hypothetical protein